MIVGIIKRLFADRTGGTAIEYGLIVALVVDRDRSSAIVQLANVTIGNVEPHVSTAVTAVTVN